MEMIKGSFFFLLCFILILFYSIIVIFLFVFLPDFFSDFLIFLLLLFFLFLFFFNPTFHLFDDLGFVSLFSVFSFSSITLPFTIYNSPFFVHTPHCPHFLIDSLSLFEKSSSTGDCLCLRSSYDSLPMNHLIVVYHSSSFCCCAHAKIFTTRASFFCLFSWNQENGGGSLVIKKVKL